MGEDEDLFDYSARLRGAKAARDEALTRVEEHAAPDWSDVMHGLVVEVARDLPLLNADDVFDLAEIRGVSSGTHDRRAFGPVMLRAMREGIVRKANVPARLSRRASRHAAPLSMWVSLIWGKA